MSVSFAKEDQETCLAVAKSEVRTKHNLTM